METHAQKVGRLADAWFQGNRDYVRDEIPYLTVNEVLDIVARLMRLSAEAGDAELAPVASFRVALEQAEPPDLGPDGERLVAYIRGFIARAAAREGRTFDEEFARFKDILSREER